MKRRSAYIFIILALANIYSIQTQSMAMESSCFSKENFDQVYSFIKAQMKEREYLLYQSYEWHLTDEKSIVMKKDNYSLAIIDREKGIYSLAKILSDNQNLVRKANASFCELVEEARLNN